MNIRIPVFYLREYFFPAGCGGCGASLLNARDAYYGLCPECMNFMETLFAAEVHCDICGKLLVSEGGRCLLCREKARANGEVRYSKEIVRLYSFFPYTGKFKTILGAYKFEKSLGAGNFLALFPERVPEAFRGEGAAWVPVPPKAGKIKKQGWDQIEYLSGLLERARKKSASGNSLPVRRCLRRLASRSQKELNRAERGTNLKGRILCVKPPPRKAVIFDDVVTTGATMNACASALLKAGAEEVYGVSLFYD